MKQKHFIDIQNIREEDTELRNRNTYAFDKPCKIQITGAFGSKKKPSSHTFSVL